MALGRPKERVVIGIVGLDGESNTDATGWLTSRVKRPPE